MKYSLPESLSTSKDISLCHRVDIRLMVFEYEVYAVDQLAGNFHDGLARYHPLAVVLCDSSAVPIYCRLILDDNYFQAIKGNNLFGL